MIIAYVCWEYRAETPDGVERNIEGARKLAERINAIPGWRALVPHNLSTGLAHTLSDREWLDFDLEIMRRAADVLVFNYERSASPGCIDERLEFRGPKIEETDLDVAAATMTNQRLGRWGQA